MWGQTGSDDIRGGKGRDSIRGGSGADVIRGGAGGDVLRGGRGVDSLTGNAGVDDCSDRYHALCLIYTLGSFDSKKGTPNRGSHGCIPGRDIDLQP